MATTARSPLCGRGLCPVVLLAYDDVAKTCVSIVPGPARALARPDAGTGDRATRARGRVRTRRAGRTAARTRTVPCPRDAVTKETG